MISQGYQESVVKKSMGNNLKMTMFKTNAASCEKQIDDEFLTQAGVKTIEERDKTGNPSRILMKNLTMTSALKAA